MLDGGTGRGGGVTTGATDLTATGAARLSPGGRATAPRSGMVRRRLTARFDSADRRTFTTAAGETCRDACRPCHRHDDDGRQDRAVFTQNGQHAQVTSRSCRARRTDIGSSSLYGKRWCREWRDCLGFFGGLGFFGREARGWTGAPICIERRRRGSFGRRCFWLSVLSAASAWRGDCVRK